MCVNIFMDKETIEAIKEDFYKNLLTFPEMRGKYHISNKKIRKICTKRRRKSQPNKNNNIKIERRKKRKAQKDQEIFKCVLSDGFLRTLLVYNIKPKKLIGILLANDITNITVCACELDLLNLDFKKLKQECQILEHKEQVIVDNARDSASTS